MTQLRWIRLVTGSLIPLLVSKEGRTLWNRGLTHTHTVYIYTVGPFPQARTLVPSGQEATAPPGTKVPSGRVSSLMATWHFGGDSWDILGPSFCRRRMPCCQKDVCKGRSAYLIAMASNQIAMASCLAVKRDRRVKSQRFTHHCLLSRKAWKWSWQSSNKTCSAPGGTEVGTPLQPAL